jgi:hypothetical protein
VQDWKFMPGKTKGGVRNIVRAHTHNIYHFAP